MSGPSSRPYLEVQDANMSPVTNPPSSLSNFTDTLDLDPSHNSNRKFQLMSQIHPGGICLETAVLPVITAKIITALRRSVMTDFHGHAFVHNVNCMNIN